MRKMVIAALAATLLCGSANATLIPELRSTSQNVDGSYSYTYGVTLTIGSQLIGSATSDAAGNPAKDQFGTIYDFGSVGRDSNGNVFISATGQMTAFNYTFNDVDTPASGGAPIDLPNRGNVRFTYLPTNTLFYVSGDTYTAPSGTAAVLALDNRQDNVGTFTVTSRNSPALLVASNYDASLYRSASNTAQSDSGFVRVPAPAVAAVPEPATWAMMLVGFGMLGYGMRRMSVVKRITYSG